MPRTRRQVNRRTALTIIVVISIVGLFLPTDLTSRAISLVQVLIPFQDVANRSVHATGQLLAGDGPAISAAEANQLRQRVEILRNQNASLRGRIHDLNEQVDFLARIRHQQLNDGRLIAGRVVGTDALDWRQSRLIDVGALSGVRQNAAVASHRFTAHVDDPTLLQDGMSVLAGEVLVGFVEQVGTHAARVRLLTDEATKMPVLVARRDQDEFSPHESTFWLTGTGLPRLLIPDVDRRYIDDGAIAVGDTVLTTSQDLRLPACLVIGTVSEIRPDPGNALLAQLWVTPAVKPAELRQVFVVDPNR